MAPELDYVTMSSDIVIRGTLRKAKTWNKRYFVLREGNPPKLEYYENERKWKVNKPKRQISLGNPWNIDKKKDSKHEFLIVIFTKDEYFTMAADTVELQNDWITALTRTVRPAPGLTMFKYMWQVVLENKELETSNSNLSLHGPHRICLTHDSMVFIASHDRTGTTPTEILITNIRVCGHKENTFFIEPGRASGIGNGKLWMDVGDEAMAAQMHTTMLNVMYALRQEEANNSYRGRSNSSGSNSGRTRNTRSHNNPPPSQIGMGKMSLAYGKRNRCDSLPATHIVGLQDSRLRTGSEGETTMKKPLRYHSMRVTNGPVSPGMRSRLAPTYKRSFNYHHSTSHSHTSSLPGSCNSSSTASSTEHLNSGMVPHSEFSSGYMSGSVTCSAHTSESASADEYNSHSPTQGYLHAQQPRNKHLPMRNTVTETSHSIASTPPIQEDVGYCPTCSHGFPNQPQFSYQRMETVPPLPDMQPTPLKNHSEYSNISAHSRTHSLDDNLSSGTAASSLSGSPYQSIAERQAEAAEKQEMKMDSDPRVVHSKSNSFSSTLDDYTIMDFEKTSTPNKYPHLSAQTKPPPVQNSFLAKFGLFTSQNLNTGNSNATITTTQAAEEKDGGYVPMKAVSSKSLPKEIESRRQSVPDMTYRGGNYSSNGSWSLYGSSPEKPNISLKPRYCNSCLTRTDDYDGHSTALYTKMAPSSPHYNCHLKLSSEYMDMVGDLHHDVAITPSPSNNNEDYLSMRPLNTELLKMKDASNNVSLSDVTNNGYIPMSPVSAGTVCTGSRKSILSSILSVAMDTAKTTAPQYPHQQKEKNSFSTHSLDRTHKKRPKSLGFRHTTSSNTRRTQSVKHSKKTACPALTIHHGTSPPGKPPLSPGGEYVNIDFEKAQLQAQQSPFVVKTNVTPPPTDRGLDYTEMNFGTHNL